MKKNIYYLLSTCCSLSPNTGDQISEINIIKSLMKNYNVYYNGVLFGSKEKSDAINKVENKYDFYIIRNNPKILSEIRSFYGQKIYFGSPYDVKSFAIADHITVFTKSWEEKLKSGWSFPYKAYPGGYKTDNVITIKQSIGAQFSPDKKRSIKTKKIRKSIGGKFIIGHFGKVSDSCYPFLLEKNIDRLMRDYPYVRIVFAGNKSIKNIFSNKHVTYSSFSYGEMPYALAACDLILYNYNDLQGHIAGSMKVLESMGCGVPVHLPRYDARVDELGADYPFFYNYEDIKDLSSGSVTRKYSQRTIDDFYDKIQLAINNPYVHTLACKEVVKRSQQFKIENHSIEVQKLLEGLK